jgi:hypothetical protein
MNKITKALVAILITASTTAGYTAVTAHAEPTKTSVVVIDTAIDASLPIFKGRLVQEVCAMEWNLCPNGTGFQEGPGSASTIPFTALRSSSFNHGTQMASIAVNANANVSIIFIRIVGLTKEGYRASTTEASVVKALDWVIANKDKYGIAAVAMSQGNHDLATYNILCPKSNLIKYIDTLKSIDIPLMLPAGNDADITRVDYPACIPQAVTIGAVDKFNNINTYSNGTPLQVDFYTPGTVKAILPGGTQTTVAGTSASVQSAAVHWATVKMVKPNLTYDQIYTLLKTTSTLTSNAKVKNGSLINIEKATK